MNRLKTFDIPTGQDYFSTKEVTTITGMTKDALRYYEHLQILGEIKRNNNNYRQYSRRNLERLQFVRIFQTLGLDLSLLTQPDIELTNEKKATELRNYRQTVRQEINHLQDIDTFLTNKINYFEN